MIAPSKDDEEHDALSTAEDILRDLAAAWGPKGKPKTADVVSCVKAATLGCRDVRECLNLVADVLWRIRQERFQR